MRLPATVFVLVAATLPAISTAAPAVCEPGSKWNEPARPRRIFGNTWYVGLCGLSSILISSKHGLVLIDGTLERAAPLIEANIRKLGFRVRDVRYILNSHEHYDHAGGIARLQRDSHAVVVARAPAAAAFARGHGDRTDPQFLSAKSFPPITRVRTIADGANIVLGKVRLAAHATPGHTPGSTTWTWKSCEGSRCLDVVYADSLTAVSDNVFRYSDEAAHPGYLDAFRHSIATIAALPCDILLTPHTGASDFWNRVGPNATRALIDRQACRRYAHSAAQALRARVAREKAAPKR